MGSPTNFGRTRDDFKYSALASGTEIRLIRVHSGNTKDVVSVSLRTVDLEDKPIFTALSYTCRKQRRASEVGLGIAKETFARSWKEKKLKFAMPDEKPIVEYTESILCNEKNLLVTPALHEVLNYFREIGSTREYWIDAICMNQGDNEERTSQVKLMGRIYSSAKLVFVWLGSYSRWREGIPGLEMMAQCLTDDQLPPLDIVKSDEDDTTLPAGMISPSGTNVLGVRWSSEAILALELTQRLWFTRVWVLQEYFLARRVVFYYAGQQISKEAIRKAFIWVYANTGERRFQRKGLSLYSGVFARMWSSHGLEFPFLLAAREAILQGENLTLVEWIRACRGRQAGDPRDFVCAGLSLLGKDRVWIDRKSLQLKRFNDCRSAFASPPNTSRSAGQRVARQPPEKSTTLLPRGLWANLEPLYEASEAEVFINLAACILSEGPNQVSGLLSTAARPIQNFEFFPPIFIHPISSTFDGGVPSWAPVLGSWTTRMSSDLMTARPEAGGGAATFAAATSGTSPNARSLPQISPDGRTLSLKVISLGIIDKENNYTIDSRADRNYLTGFIKFLLELPSRTTDGGWTSFDGVATCLATCLTAESKPFGATEGSVPSVDERTLPTDGQSPPMHRPRLWLCEILDREVHDGSRTMRRKISRTDDEREKKDLTMWLADLHSLYLHLITRYADLPWSGKSHDHFDTLPSEPLHRSERSKKDGLRPDKNRRRGRSEERTAQKSRKQEKMTRTTIIQWRRKPRVSLEAREYHTAILREMRFFKRMFLTTDGSVGIGPSWLRVNDRLMLVQGASVPYLFRHVSDANLGRIIQQARASLEKLKEKIAESRDKDLAKAHQKGHGGKDSQATLELKKRASGLRAKIREHELQIERDAWFLVGEAYVDGIMHGEAMARAGVDAFEQISVV